MALQKRSRFRNVDMRRFPNLLPLLGPDYLTEEDYFNVSGPEAAAFYREYGKDPLISDLLNRYSFARFGLGDDESTVSTFDRDDPRFKEGPIREYIPGVIDYDLPDVTSIPVTSIQKLRDQLEMAIEGQGEGSPIQELGYDENDLSIEDEKILERFKSQARKDFVNLKDFLGEEVSEKEREFAFKPEEVDYGDFTPIRDRSSIEYEPSESLGYVAPIFDENFLPMELPESNFTPVDPDKDLEYTPLEELLNSKAKGGLVGLPIIARSNGGSSNSSSSSSNNSDNNEDEKNSNPNTESSSGGYGPDLPDKSFDEETQGLPDDKDNGKSDNNGNGDDGDKEKTEDPTEREEEISKRADEIFAYEDDFGIGRQKTPEEMKGVDIKTRDDFEQDISVRDTGRQLDAIDLQTIKDLGTEAALSGLDVQVGIDPETQTVSYEGPDAVSFGIDQIGQGLSSLGSIASDFGKGLYSVSPTTLLTSVLFGDPTERFATGAGIFKDLTGRDPVFKNFGDSIKGLGDTIEKSIKGRDPDQIESSDREISDVNKAALNALSFEDRSEVESKAEQLSQQTNISYNEALADIIDDYFYG